MKRATNNQPVLDLFCGAGGLSLGFKMAGFGAAVGVEHDAAAAKTFLASHPGSACHVGDIHSFNPDAGGAEKERPIVIVGGPPCQGFSFCNHGRSMDDPRTGLVREYVRIVADLKPRWIVVENVVGMLQIDGGSAFKAAMEAMETLGYMMAWKVMNAEDYGVPQLRRRVVAVGNRMGKEFVFPEPTHGPGKLPLSTLRDAIADLPAVCNGKNGSGFPFASAPLPGFQTLMRDGGEVATCHAATKLSAINLERMKHVPQGGSWRDIPFDLLPAGLKKARRCDHTKRYGRLSWDTQACTMLTKCDPHWGAVMHPEQERAFTPREAARIQSFPDSVVFSGSSTDQYRQIGNAVPPLLAKAVAMAILAQDV